jgi:hypothetical protein
LRRYRETKLTKTLITKVAAKQPKAQARPVRGGETRRAAAKSAAAATTKRRAAAAPAAAPTPAAEPVAPLSKQARLIAQLRSPEGATITALVKLTGWQPHTVRGTISGVLRKKLQLQVVCAPEGDAGRVYRIVAPV